MDGQEDFPALGAGNEEKKIQNAGTNSVKEEGKIADGTNNAEKPKTKLKLGTRSFASRNFVPKPAAPINYYTRHEEPSMKESDFFPTLGGGAPAEPVVSENTQKHQEFLTRHEIFKPYICLIPKELWYVHPEYIDEFGYPVMNMLPDLYAYLWGTYQMFFNPDGTWNTTSQTVMSTLGELWQHAEWRDRILEKENREMEEWERKMREWEEEYYDEDDDGYGLDDAEKFGGSGKSKNKKKKKKPGKKPMPPPKPQNYGSYKRFEKKKDETIIAKPKTNFKDVSEITFEEDVIEVDETRNPSSLVFIGHVDVGKSTICGNLMFMSGMVDQRTIDKFKQEAKEKNRDSWWLAYVMDINDDEKNKGKTVEVGRATLETSTKRYTVFDAPGHKNYVPDMIMGAAMSDLAALVISARKGEYESGFERDGQTREHAQLARSLGVDRLIVIVNKMDEDSVNWSQDRYNEIVDGVTPFLINSCGFKQENLMFIPISGLTGENIEKIGNKTPWYTGPSLLDALDNIELPQRNPEGALRVPVLDKMKDRGVIAFGKVESGTIKIGSKLTVMPNDIHCQVTGIYNCKQELVKYATPGENIQVKVRMIDDESLINRGDVLCPYDNPAPITELFEAELQILELLPHLPIISPGYKSMMHLHCIGDEVEIKTLKGIYELDGNGNEYVRKNPKYCKSGAKCLVTIKSRVPVSAEKYSDIEQMGRFTLRDEGKTIALGKILRYKPAEKKVEEVNPYEEVKDASAEDSKVNQ